MRRVDAATWLEGQGARLRSLPCGDRCVLAHDIVVLERRSLVLTGLDDARVIVLGNGPKRRELLRSLRCDGRKIALVGARDYNVDRRGRTRGLARGRPI